MSESARPRDNSLDVMRGVIMILMAIDHVRVYSGIPAGGPSVGIFFTRWITHFCAPGFAFFAGASAFFNGRKLGDTGALSRYLAVRGLLLVVLELTVIRFAWTFNLNYAGFTLAGVIWMLGWCMVMLAGLVRFKARTVGVIGLCVILFQQIFGMLPRALPEAARNAIGPVWEFFYPAGLHRTEAIAILYVLIPWIGVMAAGYGFGLILIREAAERRRLCLRIGIAATAMFLIAGCLTLSGPPDRPALLRLLDQSKYPPSQLYLLMTLGPMIALLPFAGSMRGWAADALALFGRVPMFYYLLHIPAIHIAALIVNYLREGVLHTEWYAHAPFAQVPPDHRWGLPLLYLVFAIVVVALYFPCLWFAGFKLRRRGGWTGYV